MGRSQHLPISQLTAPMFTAGLFDRHKCGVVVRAASEGVDFVPSMDNTVQLIGMKAWCNLSQTPATRTMYERMIRGMMEILGFGDQVPPGPQPWKQLGEPLWLSARMPYYSVYGT